MQLFPGVLSRFALKEVHVRGLLGPTGVHHFPSKVTECLQTPVGRLSNVEVHWLIPSEDPCACRVLGNHTLRVP